MINLSSIWVWVINLINPDKGLGYKFDKLKFKFRESGDFFLAGNDHNTNSTKSHIPEKVYVGIRIEWKFDLETAKS